MKTQGSEAIARAVWGSGNEFANQLPEAVVKEANGGREGGAGWAIRSPRNAQVMLSFDPLGICTVRIAEADEQSTRAQFLVVALAAAAKAGTTLSQGPAEIRAQNGAKIIYQMHTYPMGDRTIGMALSTSDTRVGATQDFMTFGFVQPEK